MARLKTQIQALEGPSSRATPGTIHAQVSRRKPKAGGPGPHPPTANFSLVPLPGASGSLPSSQRASRADKGKKPMALSARLQGTRQETQLRGKASKWKQKEALPNLEDPMFVDGNRSVPEHLSSHCGPPTPGGGVGFLHLLNDPPYRSGLELLRCQFQDLPSAPSRLTCCK